MKALDALLPVLFVLFVLLIGLAAWLCIAEGWRSAAATGKQTTVSISPPGAPPCAAGTWSTPA